MLSLLLLAFVAAQLIPVAGQQLNGTRFYVDYNTCSEQCIVALNDTVIQCPHSLLDSARNNFRLPEVKLKPLCQQECFESLNTARQTIAENCNSSSDLIIHYDEEAPATAIIELFIYTFQNRCKRDAESGQFCDTVFTSWLDKPALTDAELCSDCALGLRQLQLNSSFGYDEDTAERFASATQSCNKTGYTYTTPVTSTKDQAAPTIQRLTATAPTCPISYTVQEGDTCDSISIAHNASTFAIVRAGGVDASCSNLLTGSTLCLPQPCILHRVEFGDTCASIISAQAGLTPSRLAHWNPNLDPLCRYLETLAGSYLCVGYLGIERSETASWPSVTAMPIQVSRPTNAFASSSESCARWYTVQPGGYCAILSMRQGITLDDFLFLNPEIDANCTNLLLNVAYCVQASGDIETYSGYTTKSPPYSLTSMVYLTSAASQMSPWPVLTTSIAPMPPAPGTSDNCSLWIESLPYVGVQDQAVSPVLSVVNPHTNDCDFAFFGLNITMEELIAMNPALGNSTECMLEPGFSYCASNGSDTDVEYTYDPHRKCLEVEEPFVNTTTSCSCFTVVEIADQSYIHCANIVESYSITLNELLSWNSWLGTDCDTGLFANMTDSEQRPVCVGIQAENISSTTSVLLADDSPPSTTKDLAVPSSSSGL